jgi:hypothetical protein
MPEELTRVPASACCSSVNLDFFIASPSAFARAPKRPYSTLICLIILGLRQVCWRERPLMGNFRGGPERQELAVGSTDRRNTF